MFKLSQIVKVGTDDGPVEATVTRVWDRPKSDPYVTVKTNEPKPRTFVRCSSRVEKV